jgi:hypothetical protein
VRGCEELREEEGAVAGSRLVDGLLVAGGLEAGAVKGYNGVGDGIPDVSSALRSGSHFTCVVAGAGSNCH